MHAYGLALEQYALCYALGMLQYESCSNGGVEFVIHTLTICADNNQNYSHIALCCARADTNIVIKHYPPQNTKLTYDAITPGTFVVCETFKCESQRDKLSTSSQGWVVLAVIVTRKNWHEISA